MTDGELESGLAVLENRARRATYATWTVIVAAALTALGELQEFAGTVDFEAVEPTPLTGLFALVYVVAFIALVVSVVLVAMWIHRAHANLFAAGVKFLDFTPGWSVGWFFVPIANLWMPFQAMRELWHASHGARDRFSAPAPTLFTIWWSAWIVGNIADNASVRMSWSESPAAVHYSYALGATGSVLTVVAALTLLQIIARVTAAQRETLRA